MSNREKAIDLIRRVEERRIEGFRYKESKKHGNVVSVVRKKLRNRKIVTDYNIKALEFLLINMKRRKKDAR